MTEPLPPHAVRRPLPAAPVPARRAGLGAGLWAVPAALLTVVTTATPAAATPPDQWAEADAVSPLSFLLVLAIIPLGLFAVISLLAVLPSMTRAATQYQPGLAWRHEPEWFGGPRDGVARVESGQLEAGQDAGSSPRTPVPADERGGASARW